MNKLSLTCWGGVGTATGANFLLEAESGAKLIKIAIDCGLTQGSPEAETRNREPFPYDPALLDFLFITHAHADHVGLVPKLVRGGFRGAIYSTPETRRIAEVMLDDTAELLNREAKVRGILPLYERADVSMALSLWKTVAYHETLALGDAISVMPKDAGHILGSAMYEFSHAGKKIVFTGDLGNSPSLLLRETESAEGAGYLVMESVYGDRNHEPKEGRKEKLKQAVLDTIKRGGTLVIPAFSIERTQVLLYELNLMIEGREVPLIPVYLDSPLAIRVTEIYREMKDNFNDSVRSQIAGGDDIFNFPKLKLTMTSRASEHIDAVSGPKIVMAGSGMSEGGRVVHHEERYLSDPKNIILEVGYQAAGTFGRQLREGVRKVFINGGEIEVRAEIRGIDGYSSHADSDHLLQFVEKASGSLKKVFVAMGELRSSSFLAQRIRDYLGVDAVVPERGKAYEL